MRTSFFLLSLALLLGRGAAWAADGAPVVGPGATKEDVINAYGWPAGQSKLGPKEILSYPQGEVTIENGRVQRVDFSPDKPWPAPRPRPGPASPTSVKKAEAPLDFWLVHFEDAQRDAAARHARILALFIGSDWSPPSRQFQDEVAFNTDFIREFTGDFVFLRLDYPTRAPQPADLHEQNTRLREKYNVTTYPSLLVLSPAGTAVATIDLTKAQPGETYRDRVIAAVREVRDLLVAHPPAPDPAPAAAAATPKADGASTTAGERPVDVGEASVSKAAPLIIGAVAGGLVLVAFGWWLLWRMKAPRENEQVSMAERISAAASGVPSVADLQAWPLEKLRAVVAALAEADGYEVTARGGGGDGDLALQRPGEEKPRVIVACFAGSAGIASAKRIRELFGTLTLEAIPTGWFVAPMGFAADARQFAREHQIELIDADQMTGQMSAVPPIVLQKVLMRERA